MWGFTRCSTIANCERYYYYYYFKKKISKFSFLQTKINKRKFPHFNQHFHFPTNPQSHHSLVKQFPPHVCLCAFPRLSWQKQEKKALFHLQITLTSWGTWFWHSIKGKAQFPPAIDQLSTGGGFFSPSGHKTWLGYYPLWLFFTRKFPNSPSYTQGKKRMKTPTSVRGKGKGSTNQATPWLMNAKFVTFIY